MSLKKTIPILTLLSTFISIAFGQGNVIDHNAGKIAWTASPFEQKAFIENKGQFDDGILFSASVEGVDLNFTSNGLVWKHIDHVQMTEDEIEEWKESHPGGENEEECEEEEERKLMKSIPQYLSMQWLNSNPDVEVIAEEQVSFYYTYGGAGKIANTTIKANAYEKIVYKNLYPHIDVEYVFPSDKSGIKYSIILHPGANPSDIKMKYDGASGISIDADGNALIESMFGEFVDHSPESFYQDNNLKIHSAFLLNGSEVSFVMDTYDHNRTVVIDPWTTNPTFVGFNSAYDINFDLNGNVYAFGSYNPLELVKLNSSGVIQWVFTATGLGNCWINNFRYGDFAVDEISGTSYLIEGAQMTGARVFKVNTLGIQTGTFPGNASLQEMWRAEYNRCINKIIIGGGGTNSPNQAAVLDTNLANFIPINILSAPDQYHDIALLSIDNNSSFCYMATSEGFPGFNNTLIKSPIPALLPLSFSVPDGHKFLEQLSNNYVNRPLTLANGMNGMSVGTNWLYTYDGDSLKRWDKSSGNFDSAIDISPLPPTYFFYNDSSILVSWSGLSADECDNIYIGLETYVKEFSSSLSLNNTYVLPDTVYDVKYGPNNKLYACGKNFVTQIDLPPHNTTVTVVQTPSTNCITCNGTATVSAISCGANPAGFAYAWSTNPVQTTQTAMGLCAGNYTVTVTSNCYFNYIGNVVVTDSQAITFATLGPDTTVCGADSIILDAGSGFASYLWSSGSNVQSIIANQPGSYWVMVTDSCGNVASDTIMVALSPSPVVSLLNDTLLCFGEQILLDAGNPGMNYVWSDNSTSQTISVSSPGVYAVTVTNAGGCASSDTVLVDMIPQNEMPVANVGNDTSLCIGGMINVGVQDTSNGNWNYLWTPTGDTTSQINFTVTGDTTLYLFVFHSSGVACAMDSDSVYITLNPSFAISPPEPITACKGEIVTLGSNVNNQNLIWRWEPITGLQNPNVNPTMVEAKENIIYQLFVTDPSLQPGCNTDTIQVSLIVEDCVTENVISPNGDGMNDYFDIGNFYGQPLVVIYDRWGREIYRKANYQNDWGGKNKNGDDVPVGVYYYTIFPPEMLKPVSGWVMVVR